MRAFEESQSFASQPALWMAILCLSIAFDYQEGQLITAGLYQKTPIGKASLSCMVR
jgi:hypothetical protein